MDMDFGALLANVVWWRVGLFLVLGPLLFGNACSLLRARHRLQDGYSRKLHHVGIMLISGPCLAVLPDEQLLPSMIVASLALITISFIAAYSRVPVLAGMAAHSLRRRDAPHSRFFFLMPMITSNVAITISALLFPLTLVKVAFFTVAVADGLAEPVGVRFGASNTYRVQDIIWGWTNTKSVAGSATVFVLSAAVFAAVLSISGHAPVATVPVVIAFAALTTTIEAFSPRGMDNMLIMLITPVFLLAFGVVPW
ncbi:hypothetical protein [Caldimonas sp.]|uniref:hypothetical protein n=1 Tax=Caldimonas sp. TaxID=2838790 RepID=UPI00391B613C